MQRERQPDYPLLYSLQGFQYATCSSRPRARPRGNKCRIQKSEFKVRIEQDLPRGREARAQTLKWMENDPGVPVLTIALDHLTLAAPRSARRS